MRFEPIAEIAGAFRVWREPFTDARGSFDTSFAVEEFAAAGIDFAVAQAATSTNPRTGTLRGLHYQLPPAAQAKLVWASAGRLFDVMVDLRRGSPTEGAVFTAELAAGDGLLLYLPAGLAHGYQTLAPDTAMTYLMGAPYRAALARGVRWDCPVLGIRWPLPEAPLLSPRDRDLPDVTACER